MWNSEKQFVIVAIFLLEVTPCLFLALGDQQNDCRRSRFGCCPDGVTIARGNNNEGCPNACKVCAVCFIFLVVEKA
jgi:hypothetical protein